MSHTAGTNHVSNWSIDVSPARYAASRDRIWLSKGEDMSATLKIKVIHWRRLCRMFNNGNYRARVQSGELTERVLNDRHPSAPRAPVPYCTRSQIITYHDAAGRR